MQSECLSKTMNRWSITKSMHPFSIVIITFNEAENIGACLAAAQKVSNDIVVVDAFSNDETVQICEKIGARVIQKEWVNYSVNKNFGNELAKNDWILSLDADEVLSDELINSIRELTPEKGKVYLLDRISSYCGKWIRYGGWYPDWKIRIFNRKEIKWKGYFVHEILEVPPHFRKVLLKGKLLHYSYQTKVDFEKRLSKYAELAGNELYAKKKKATFFKLWVSPIIRFLRDFLFKRGFLDGKAGWEIASGNASVVFRKYRILKRLNRTSDA